MDFRLIIFDKLIILCLCMVIYLKYGVFLYIGDFVRDVMNIYGIDGLEWLVVFFEILVFVV